MGEFDGRVAIVTGAGSGIGAASARAFARDGAHVALWDIDMERVQKVASELTEEFGPTAATAFTVDVSDDEAVAAQLELLLAREGRVDHLVNSAVNFLNAGMSATREQWERVLAVNVIGPSLLTAKVARHMGSGSTIVNVSSISAHVAQPDRWTYNACKAAILAVTRGQALDLRARGIRANSVSPGWIWTPEVARAAGGDRQRWEPEWGRYHILERLGEPSEVAEAVLFLSSSRSSFITGTELFADGGYSAIGPEGLGETAKFAGSTHLTD
jgi:NAD(P)-dependent dehydrogenase (short-subunit alcohol dehydrogenase family)